MSVTRCYWPYSPTRWDAAEGGQIVVVQEARQQGASTSWGAVVATGLTGGWKLAATGAAVGGGL